MTKTLSHLKRLSLAVVLLVSILSPSLASAQMTSLIGSPVLGPGIGRYSYGGLLALEIPPSGASAGPRIAGEVMYGLTDLAPQLRLDVGGRVAFGYHSIDTFGTNASASIWLLDFVPDAKIRYAFTDQLGIYGDFGLGLGYFHSSASATVLGTNVSSSNSNIGLTVQFGAGVAYAVTPNINLLGEIRFNIYTGDASGTYIAIPTIGVEFH